MPLVPEEEPIDEWYALAERLGMSAKQKAFVDYYLTTAYFNATKAAKEAGYADPNKPDSAATVGSVLLRNAKVREYMQERLKADAASPEECIDRVQKRARATMEDVIDPVTHKISLEYARQTGAIHLIKSVSDTDKGLKIEMYPADAADALLLKVHGRLAGGPPDSSGNSSAGDTTEQKLKVHITYEEKAIASDEDD